VRGVSWLDPDDCVTATDLEAAERVEHVRIRTGDLLFVRVGHRRRRQRRRVPPGRQLLRRGHTKLFSGPIEAEARTVLGAAKK